MKDCVQDTRDLIAFQNNIIRLRKSNHLSKCEMAKRLGISIYALNQLESGILPDTLRVDIVLQIHKNFGIRPRDQFRE